MQKAPDLEKLRKHERRGAKHEKGNWSWQNGDGKTKTNWWKKQQHAKQQVEYEYRSLSNRKSKHAETWENQTWENHT